LPEHRSGCPINLTLEVIGDRWSLLILRDMMFGHRRHLRELLRATFRAMRRLPDAFEVSIEVGGETLAFEHPDAAEAYGMALLALIRRTR